MTEPTFSQSSHFELRIVFEVLFEQVNFVVIFELAI